LGCSPIIELIPISKVIVFLWFFFERLCLMFLIFMAVLSGSLPLSPRVLARFPNCDEDTSSSATSNRFMAPADNQASVSPLSARPVRDVGYFGPERVSTGMIDQPFGSQLPFRALGLVVCCGSGEPSALRRLI